MNHERLEWHGKGFCGVVHRVAVPRVSLPGRGLPARADVLPLRRLVHRHHDRDQPLRARLPRGPDPLRRQPVHLDGGRGALRRHRPAGLHQLRALGHRRLGARVRLRHAQVRAGQPPAHRAGAAVHRAARREPGRTTRSSRGSPTSSACGDVYTEGGLTELDWVKRIFDASDLPERISWDEFAEKGYYLVPVSDEHKATPALRWFAEDRKRDTPDWGPPPWDVVGGKGLATQSGKIEFVSSSLKRFYESGDVVDEERPVMGPQYIESWEGHRTDGAHRQVPAAAHLAAPALQLPHHGRRQGRLGRGHRGPPRAQGRRLVLLADPPEQRGRGGARHRRRRPGARVQRPRRGRPLRAQSPTASGRARRTRRSRAPTTRRPARRATRRTAPAASTS